MAIEVSSIRAQFSVRGADLPLDYEVLPSVDQEFRQCLGGSRKANASESGTSSGLHSHVLLAGTSAKGVAYEDPTAKRGVFTSALLDLLERASPDTISYKDAIERLPNLYE
jgi:hypothetical protein